jgi:hypothetical protein
LTAVSPLLEPDVLAQRVAAAVSAHPDVAGLHGGVFGAVVTYLPGRRLTGVRIGTVGEPVEVGVVLRLHRPIPAVVADLRRRVSDLCGGTAVDITVADVAPDAGDVT